MESVKEAMFRYLLKKLLVYNMYRLSRKDDRKDANQSRYSPTIMSPEDVAAGKQSFWSELLIGGKVVNLSPRLFCEPFTHLTSLLIDNNQIIVIPSDISKLTHLQILSASNNNITTIPKELGECIELRKLLLANNRIRFIPYEIGKLYNIQEMDLQKNPLTIEFSSIYHNSNCTHLLQLYLLDHCKEFRRLPSPPRRPMISLFPPYNSTKTFSVMSYNVLSDKYASSLMYNYCPKWALAWSYRKERILMEIMNQQADIICLQEVEMEQFTVLFSPHLLTLGYTGIYSPKSRAKTMHESDRKFVDGCAIFFKNTKFVLVKEVLIEFNQLAMANAEGIEHMLNRVMTKDNIGLAAVLHTIDTDASGSHFQIPQHLIVCNAHIHWDPEYCDVKLIQVMMLTSEISRLMDEYRECSQYSKCDNVHVLIAGDFNSLPDSGVIEFLSRGRVSQDHRDFKQLSYKSCLDKLTSICDISNEFTHSISLASAYTDEMISYTNYSYTFKGIIDYIFYSKGSLRVLNVLGPVSDDWFSEYNVVGCPNPIIPSDHVPLYAEFEMMDLASMSNGITAHR